MELFLIIAVPILIGGVLYWYAMAEKDKQESRCNRLSVLANSEYGDVREILTYSVHCGRRNECHVNQE